MKIRTYAGYIRKVNRRNFASYKRWKKTKKGRASKLIYKYGW